MLSIIRRPEHNLNLGRGEKKDNMSSSLPAFNQLQLSFPQLEAKTHGGVGGSRTKMQHTNWGQYNTEQNVNKLRGDMKTKSYSIKCVEWAKSANLSVQMIFGAKVNLACSMDPPLPFLPDTQWRCPPLWRGDIPFFKYHIAMQFKMSPRCFHLFNITQLLI